MDRTASRLRDLARLGLVGAIALLLALSRTSIATASSDLVLICHGTGSASNEIVIIRVDPSGLNGHELEELAKTYDCQPAGGSGGSTDGGTTGGGSGGFIIDGGGTGTPGASPGTAGTSGSAPSPGASTSGSGGSSPGLTTGSSIRPGDRISGSRSNTMILGAAGIGPAAAEATAAPGGLTLAAGGVRIAVPMTDTIVRFLAHSSTGQQLGVALTAVSGVGLLLLILFGSLARRRV